MSVPNSEIAAFLQRIKADQQTLAEAADEKKRATLISEKAELEDRKILMTSKAKLVARRDLLEQDEAYKKALADLQTTGITRRANELVDTHLTSAVTNQFDEERGHFEIMHLKVALARKSSQTKAEFGMDTHTKLTKVTSDILSEGEQRALALAGFLTEVTLTDGSGPIVVDDPVSSLDRDRSGRVAARLAKESLQRQVVVFTHDMIFLNELCQAADNLGVEAKTIALFSDPSGAGKVDPDGIVWKGLSASKRIGIIKTAAAQLAKLQASSPSKYEFQLKNLYGRLRDIYERVVEEFIFNEVVRRGTDVIQTQRLRGVRFSDAMANRFHEGMTRANTHSHDNPAADTVQVPSPADFAKHIGELETLITDLKAEIEATQKARPQMDPKK
jgi:hypothetical protein